MSALQGSGAGPVGAFNQNHSGQPRKTEIGLAHETGWAFSTLRDTVHSMLGRNYAPTTLFNLIIMDTQSTINQMVVITCTLLLVVGVGGSVYAAWCFSRSKFLLRSWAAKNGFQILDSTFMPFSKGLFDYFRDLQTTYHVRIRDREGREHSGWVHCGSLWTAAFKLTEASWESES
jgi:hypothetical protein